MLKEKHRYTLYQHNKPVSRNTAIYISALKADYIDISNELCVVNALGCPTYVYKTFGRYVILFDDGKFSRVLSERSSNYGISDECFSRIATTTLRELDDKLNKRANIEDVIQWAEEHIENRVADILEKTKF